MTIKKMLISKIKKKEQNNLPSLIRQTSYLSRLTQVMRASESQLTSCFFCSIAAMHTVFCFKPHSNNECNIFLV